LFCFHFLRSKRSEFFRRFFWKYSFHWNDDYYD
jgi:hypothetical protein